MSKSKKPPGDDRDSILTNLMTWGRGRSVLPPTPEAAAEPTYVPPSRQTKKTFTAWMDKDALAQLKRLSEHKRISQQKLIAEAFNLLFEKHGLPPIAT
jgi:Ribbon-helix-helix domain